MKYSEKYGRTVADRICKSLREECDIEYKKRYSSVNASGTLLKIKLFWVDRNFLEKYKNSGSYHFFKTRRFKTEFIQANRKKDIMVESFVFWLPINVNLTDGYYAGQ